MAHVDLARQTLELTQVVQLSRQPSPAFTSKIGAGIAADQQAKIFERFYRVDQARSQQIPGTGLGLAIVHRLVDLNHAQITVSDNQPHGTVFTVTFDPA